MIRNTLLWRQQQTEPWGQPTFRTVKKEGEMPKETEKALNNADQKDSAQGPPRRNFRKELWSIVSMAVNSNK